jgi:hypothetical protein
MDPFDAELKLKLKHWANRQAPPENRRARLLGAALSRTSQEERPNHFHFPTFPVELYSWAMVYSMQRGVSALKLVS